MNGIFWHLVLRGVTIHRSIGSCWPRGIWMIWTKRSLSNLMSLLDTSFVTRFSGIPNLRLYRVVSCMCRIPMIIPMMINHLLDLCEFYCVLSVCLWLLSHDVSMKMWWWLFRGYSWSFWWPTSRFSCPEVCFSQVVVRFVVLPGVFRLFNVHQSQLGCSFMYLSCLNIQEVDCILGFRWFKYSCV